MSRRGRVKYSGAYSRFRDRLDSEEDEIEFDSSRPLNESIRECLKEVTSKNGKVRKARKLAHLSALIKLWERKDDQDPSDPSSLRLREIMLCLRIPMCQDSVEVRAATLRTLRYLISSDCDVQDFITINGHFLLSRCLDIELDNKVERIQALRLIRKIAFVGPKLFPLTLLRCIVAIAEDGKKECDHLYRTCLACLCELSVLNSKVFIEANGVNVLAYCLLDSSLSRVLEAMLGCLLRLHNDPATRKSAGVELGIVVAPFTEFRYVHSGHVPAVTSTAESSTDEKVRRFQIAENAILSLMRSWPGLIQLAQPRSYGGSHLQALVDILYLKNNEVRKRLVLLLFELLNLKPPKDTSHIDLALQATNPSTFKESWKLAEGFVTAEGLDILPHLAKSRPNLLENHKSVVLSCLLRAGLSEALIEVIISTETELSILSTVLLGELLHSASVILPRELNATSHCLPALLAEISGTDPNRSNRASEAVEALQKIHSIKKRGPVACSLFFDQILSLSGRYQGESFVGDRLLSPNWSSVIKRSSEEQIRLNVKLSKVNDSIDAKTWDWDLIAAVFKWPSENFNLLDVSDHRQFVRRVSDFFKPSYNLFIKLELVSAKTKFIAKAGCHLIDFLVGGKSDESHAILDDFLRDLKARLDELVSAKSIHDCLLSPTRVGTTASQYYFAFIGRMSYTASGRKFLDKHNFLPVLAELLAQRNDLYLKLVISSLDYTSPDWGSRNLLSKALKESSELCKVYATKFLGVLIRARTPNIAQWGIELLVGQLFDTFPNVPWTALELLDEACDDKMNLEAVVCALGTDINIDHLGIRGAFLRNRFYCSTNSIKLLLKRTPDGTTVLESELKKWAEEYNYDYVIVLEDLINDGLTRHQRNEDRCYGRRSHEGHTMRDVYVPAHLYGQLALTKFGMENLIKDEEVLKLLKYLRTVSDSPPSQEWLKIKSAIWAAANIGLSLDGVLLIEREGSINVMINIAEKNQVHSLRGTAFYALGLVATTRHGSNLLSKYGWCSLRYSRDEKWPVLEDWFNRFRSRLKEDVDQTMFDDDFAATINESRMHREEATLSPETPPEYVLNVSSTESSPKGASSLSNRKRLSDLFRSFNFGSGGSSLKQRRSSEVGKSFSDKIKKNLFPRSRTQSHSSSGDRDDFPNANSPQRAVTSSLKTVPETEKTSQSDVKSTPEFLKAAPSVTVTQKSDEKTEDQKPPKQIVDQPALVTTTTAKTKHTAALTVLDGSKLAPMAKPESFADSLCQAEFETSSNNDKQTKSDLPDSNRFKPTHPEFDRSKQDCHAETSGNNKLRTETRRKGSLIKSECGVSSVTDSPVDFSTIKVEAIIEPLPKSLQQETGDTMKHREKESKSSDQKLTKFTGVSNLQSVVEPKEGDSAKVQVPSTVVRVTDVEKVNGFGKNVSSTDSIKSDDKTPAFATPTVPITTSSTSTCVKLSPIASSPTGNGIEKKPEQQFFESTPMTKEQILQHSRSRSHVRSGQRALSESEAQNMSGLSAASSKRIYGNLSTAAAASRNTWSITSISSVGSWTDNPGYLTFRSIHLRRRPPLSESESDATGTGALVGRDGHSDLLSAVPVHRSDSWSRKSRSLDYRLTKLRFRQRPPELSVESGGTFSQNRSISAPPVRPPHLMLSVQEEPSSYGGPEPQYWGITVPSRIECLFPEVEDLPEVEEEVLPVPDSTVSSGSSMYLKVKDSRGSATSQGLELHTPFSCLSCYRLFAPSATPGQLIELEPDTGHGSRSAKTSPASLRKMVTVAEGEKAAASAVSTVTGSKPDPSGSFRFGHRREIIRLISAMNATVGAKTAEQGLLKLKQLHPEAFNDLCLYSEVCLLLTRYSFRITSRRFIQELFMDLQYDALYIEPYQLLGIDLAESVSADVKEINITTSLSNRGLAQVTEALTEDVLSSAASSPFN